MTYIGDRIRALRTARGQTKAVFGDILNTTGQSVGEWERGKATPRLKSITRIADALGVSIQWLVAGRGEPPAELADK